MMATLKPGLVTTPAPFAPVVLRSCPNKTRKQMSSMGPFAIISSSACAAKYRVCCQIRGYFNFHSFSFSFPAGPWGIPLALEIASDVMTGLCARHGWYDHARNKSSVAELQDGV